MDMKKFKISKLSLILVLLAFLAAFGAIIYIRSLTPNSQVQISNNFIVQNQTDSTKSGQSSASTKLPATLNLKVPFTPQAPTANWDQLHNEACEEASAIMANAYFSGITSPTLAPADVEKQITNLTNWELQNLGHNLDTTSDQTAKMIESVYGLKTKMINNFTADDLKQQLVAGNVVLISENGQLLGNPNYKQPGPVHHMLVIRGYTPEGFITNDSGTRRGENYFYTFGTLYNAAGDWDPSINAVDLNKKIAIVVSK